MHNHKPQMFLLLVLSFIWYRIVQMSLTAARFDLHAHSEVTQRDIHELENTWQIPVLRIRNVQNSPQAELSSGGLGDVIPVLNTLCEHLWHRDVVISGKDL